MPEQQPQKAYVFDVDGVLTNPETKQIEYPEIFDELVKRLKQNQPIGLNTGRSLDFMIEQVLKPLEARVKGSHLLQNIFAIGEKGAAWVTYDENDVRTVCVDESISIPQEVQDEVKTLVGKMPYSETMFYDTTKQTMVSVEILPIEKRIGKSFDDFKSGQRLLEQDLKRILAKYHLEHDLRIDLTRIAIDVENRHAGKALGVRKFVELLQERGIDPKEYLGFGDSTSDYDMYKELLRLGKKAAFVFVGEPKHLEGKPRDGVIFTQKHVDKGTLEFLQNETESAHS